MSSRRDVTELLRALHSLDIPCVKTKSQHWKAMTPQGPVFFASTPSDRRSILNTKAELRRKGVDI